ncbi:hypothetical protein [Thalassobaculum sp.]|jgi:hypothetical protein|uniref:hypothetical protein n=1 Tax=Thalassobaculum sp. TaxID=2022740 RepID=UPI00015F18B4|nr:hypothetical protein BAL199_20085 [alpha proteobacterium BAL199]
MASPADDRWKDMVQAQPTVTQTDRESGAAARASSFAIELTDDGLLLKIRRDDGRMALVELTPDMALYLREYLTNGLASIGYIRPRS